MCTSQIARLLKPVLAGTIVLLSTAGLGTRLPGPASPSFSPVSLSFGSQAVDSSSVAQMIVITNHAASPLFIFKATGSPDFAVTNNCIHPLHRNESCQILVTFSPSFPGAEQGSVTILDSSSTSPHRLTLSGTGVTGETRRATLK